ncbi:hypothetical protein [Massilia sp. GCM10023247]|uniref:hypothetical protein n=1 Tax=Massilia sp. GCM10023247 TaxID=3252643 RepID=UPI00360B7879
MKTEDMMDLVLGLATVAIGWHLYKMYKVSQTPENPPLQGIPAAPEIQQDANGNYFFDMDKLFEGVL